MSWESSNGRLAAGHQDVASDKEVKSEENTSAESGYWDQSNLTSTYVTTPEEHAKTLVNSLRLLRYLLSEIPRRLDPFELHSSYWLSRKLLSTWMRSQSQVLRGPWMHPGLQNKTLLDLLQSFAIPWEYDELSTSFKLEHDSKDLRYLFDEAEKARAQFSTAYASLMHPDISYTIFDDQLTENASLAELLRGQYGQPMSGVRMEMFQALPSSLSNIAVVGKFVCQAIYHDETEARKQQQDYEAASFEARSYRIKSDDLEPLLDGMDVREQYRDYAVSSTKLRLEELVLKQKRCALRTTEIVRFALAGDNGQFRTFEQCFGNIDT